MKRAVVFVFFSLVTGLATTVGVAWLYAAILHPWDAENRISAWTTRSISAGNGWHVREWRGAGKLARLLTASDEPVSVGVAPFVPPAWSAASQQAPKDSLPIFEDARGWPLLALRCTWRQQSTNFLDPWDAVDGGIPLRGLEPEWMLGPRRFSESLVNPDDHYVSIDVRRSLPLVPMWPGLVANTLLFSAVAAMLAFGLSAPAVIRRWLRSRRERCVRCSYRLANITSSACPECGWGIGRRLPLLTKGRVVIAALVAALVIGGDAILARAVHARLDGPHALHLAALDGDVVEVRRLLANGVSPDVPCGDVPWEVLVEGSTPIMWAAEHGQAAVMLFLLDAGASTAGDGYWTTPLLIAARGGHADAVRVLLQSGADVTFAGPNEDDALRAAATSSSAEALLLVIEARRAATGSVSGATEALAAAAAVGRMENMPPLIAVGAELNPKKGAPLLSAINGGSIAAVERLIELGASARASGPVLWHAAEKNRADIAAVLIAAGADPNEPYNRQWGWTPLQRATLRSNLEIARQLVAAGADPHTTDMDGETIVFRIDWDDASDALVDFVLGLGIDLNQRSHSGSTALIQEVHWRRLRGVHRLLAAGADPLVADNDGHTALDHARAPLPYVSQDMGFDGNEVNEAIVELIERAIERERP